VADARPIGVFDSGVGGLTVVRAILDLLPSEPLVYLGDTARAPYGPRPVEEIRRFALEMAEYLVAEAVKMLVVACNSIEVSAIEDVAEAAGIPVAGVIDPGVRGALRATRNHVVGMIGTEATVRSGAYERAVKQARAHATLYQQACPALVDLVEAGDTTSDRVREAVAGYLTPLRRRGIDTLILGCTHYPLLSGLIQLESGPDVVLVSSAEETAKDVYATLLREGLARPADAPAPSHRFLCTGDPGPFQELAERFLGPGIGDLHVRRVELEGTG
jgi:glutamate racemase